MNTQNAIVPPGLEHDFIKTHSGSIEAEVVKTSEPSNTPARKVYSRAVKSTTHEFAIENENGEEIEYSIDIKNIMADTSILVKLKREEKRFDVIKKKLNIEQSLESIQMFSIMIDKLAENEGDEREFFALFRDVVVNNIHAITQSVSSGSQDAKNSFFQILRSEDIDLNMLSEIYQDLLAKALQDKVKKK